jgi:hypothetical protein
MGGALRGIFGYLFLILMIRIAGRRPGKQMAPFEFVLIFLMGGLTVIRTPSCAAVGHLTLRRQNRNPPCGWKQGSVLFVPVTLEEDLDRPNAQ